MYMDPARSIEPIKIFYRGKGMGEVIDIALCQFEDSKYPVIIRLKSYKFL